MRIFVSWSGDASNRLARVLRDWLPNVIQAADVWVSTEDIAKGKRWSDEISGELDRCSFGIVCLTRENLSSEWIHFEAGAIAKTLPGSLERGRVTPFVVGIPPSAIQGPLAEFQATSFERGDLLRLVRDINAASDHPLPDRRLDEAFEVWWPRLDHQIKEVVTSDVGESMLDNAASSPEGNLLEEILELIRSQQRTLLRIERSLAVGASSSFPRLVAEDFIRYMQELNFDGEVALDMAGDYHAQIEFGEPPDNTKLQLLDRWARRNRMTLDVTVPGARSTLGLLPRGL